MSEALKGALIIGQSGGPSSVINSSAYGCIRTALDADCITKVYGAYHGIKGVLNDAALDYDLCLYQFTDNLGTDFTLRNQYGSYEEDGVLKKNGSNRANLKDAKFNEMIDAALIEQDSAKREKMYNEIDLFLNETVPIFPFATSYVFIFIL